MTRQEIESEYNVVGGIIRSPGKFEGEAVYAPWCYERMACGGADIIDFPNGGRVDLIQLDDETRREWNIESSIFAIACEETAQGFYQCAELTEEGLAALHRELEKAWEECGDDADYDDDGNLRPGVDN